MNDPEGILEEFAEHSYSKHVHGPPTDHLRACWAPKTFGPERRRNDLCDRIDPDLIRTLRLFGVSDRWIARETGWGRNRVNRCFT